MEALQNRLKQLENCTGSEIWDILKESEADLIEDLSTINILKEDKEKKAQETLKSLQIKKKELENLKNDVKTLQNDYKLHVEAVEKGLKDAGLNMNDVIKVFEKVLEDSLSEKKTKILDIIASTSSKSIPDLHAPLKSILELLKDQNQDKLRAMIQENLDEFHAKCIEVFRQNLWSEFQKQGIPMKPLLETLNPYEFISRISKIFEFSSDLDILRGTPHDQIHVAFGMLSNICVDMIDNEKERDADFEWILTSAHKWAINLKEVVERAMGGEGIGKEFDKKFVEFIGKITKRFLKKNIKDPLVFSKLTALLRRFEDTCEFDLTDKDLFEPLCEPEFLDKWIAFEIEIFMLSINRLLKNPTSFNPIPAIFIGKSSTWASEITLFFEQWISRVDRDVSMIQKSDVQSVFYKILYFLMDELCSKIHVKANLLYSEASWSNDVYLVMNTIWELRRLIKYLTVTWPVSSFESEKTFSKEWHRLSGMIVEYLNDLVDGMNPKSVESINETFYHIVKCLKNVTLKASKPSMSPLMNILVEELFKRIQVKFEKCKKSCSIESLGCFYNQIYANLLPQLDHLLHENHWTRGNESRSEMCRLDALMKMEANRDPSGELVRISFRSIDEEQVIKLLKELGIHSTSDHTFQDYQILAENWNKIEHKMMDFDYGEF